jgi:hypothetical protein
LGPRGPGRGRGRTPRKGGGILRRGCRPRWCYVTCYVAAPILPGLHPPSTRVYSENRGKTGGLHPDGRRINGVGFWQKPYPNK